MIRRVLVVVTGVLGLLVVNYTVIDREWTVRSGEPLFLEALAYPNYGGAGGASLYVSYELVNQLYQVPLEGHGGRLVLARDARGTLRFTRVDDGRPLAPDERALRWRQRFGMVTVAPDLYYVDEATMEAVYPDVRYAELRVSAGGDVLLVGLRDASLQPLTGDPAP